MNSNLAVERISLRLLPLEFLQSIVELLPNRDYKGARLACRSVCNAVSLRLDGVLMSTNQRNIEIAKAVANDGTHRKRAVEIVWDNSLPAIT
ncbi:hypothetical protein PISL3812_03507 [Talaromyces islandicus]|uniref:F-box domain-containing protein n=1 Tax=Talaromyces islandicus TaxID=28573 RepID=A0A0U1LV23_TALIS|nr:hypothetical protein PISL3812_03507 [Talaromyces islandicus]